MSAYSVGNGADLLEATRERGLEGVMAKRLGSTYRPGTRSKDWRKVKNRQRVELTIGGYTRGSGNRSSTFGALLVGVPDGDTGTLKFAGGVGTGFDHRMLETLTARLRALQSADCPFDPIPPTSYRRDAAWVRPELRAPSRSPSSPTRVSSATPASSS